MPAYHVDLLDTARWLLDRRDGRLPQARIRRSISTTYYALFHFILDDAAHLVVGTRHPLQGRRRVFVRLFSHSGMLTALSKIKGRTVQQDVIDFLRHGNDRTILPVPEFAREMASAFVDTQAKRYAADYDLNRTFVAAEASSLIERVSVAIDRWREANDPAARDFKHALALLMLQKGRLRSDG